MNKWPPVRTHVSPIPWFVHPIHCDARCTGRYHSERHNLRSTETVCVLCYKSYPDKPARIPLQSLPRTFQDGFMLTKPKTKTKNKKTEKEKKTLNIFSILLLFLFSSKTMWNKTHRQKQTDGARCPSHDKSDRWGRLRQTLVMMHRASVVPIDDMFEHRD